ncbi:aromatic acid exporter family protein [Streptomyces sp. NPDC088725]|uniref:FUSC family protein n=1 Tax=Streptomyces sp. NPDC088725 TaxID=3365873 RepID=UPI0037FDF2D8
MRKALSYSGTERAAMVQALKAAVAAIAAWALAGWWLDAPMALMAPWTALALVDVTVYRSLRSALQQLAVIVVGTLWAAAALGLAGGNTLGAMIVALPPLALLGNYRGLGSQGVYGATSALFLIVYSSNSPSQIGHRLLETAIGAIIGITVNALVLPPVRLRTVREQLRLLPVESAALLREVAEGLRGDWSASDAVDWHEQAGQLAVIRGALEQERGRNAESSRLNPVRRLRRGDAHQPPPEADVRWGLVADHLRAITRTLSTAAHENGFPQLPEPRFLTGYAELADHLAGLCETAAETLETGEAAGPYQEVWRKATQSAWDAYDYVTDCFHGQCGTAAAVGGALLVETRQLLFAVAGGRGA